MFPDPVLLELYTNNPLTLAVIGFQRGVLGRRRRPAAADNLLFRMVIALFVGLVLLLAGHRVFLRLQGNFAQEL